MEKGIYRTLVEAYYESSLFKKIYKTKHHQKKVKQWLVKNWKNNNQHNFTNYIAGNQDQMKVGRFTYGDIKCLSFDNSDEMLEIGDFCSIAGDVIFIAGGGHALDNLSTYPFTAYFLDEVENAQTKGKIIVEDDVWIGYGATVLSGVTIGQGAVIGAKSVVTKNIPPYAVFAGGKIIKYRYSAEIIEKLLKFDFSKLTKEDVEQNMDLLYQNIDNSFFKTDFYLNHLKK